MLPGISLTSSRRPSRRSATALYVYTAASGFVPASVLDGGGLGLQLWLDGGKREGLVCLVLSFSKVFSAFIGDPFVFCFSYGVLCKIM
jgi:hypothetical protein